MGNFVGTINMLNQADKQAIYFSQLYGTFFGVYAQPVLNDSKEHLMAIRLWLINYKGPLNMGIVREKTELPNEDGALILENNTLKFVIYVKALSSVYGESNSVLIPVNNIAIAKIRKIKIFRELEPMNANQAFLNEVFDSEFYDRDGNDNISTDLFDNKSPGKRCKTSELLVINR